MVQESGSSPEYAHAGLLSLANELLLQIFQLLEAEDLLPLSMICRRLQHVALSLYFPHHHVKHDNSKALALTDDNLSSLPAFQISILTTSLGSLSCTLHNDGSRSIFKWTQGLINVMSNLCQVDEVLFHLDGFHRGIQKIEWHDTFIILLQLVIDKGCKTLTVEQSGLQFPDDGERDKNSLPSRSRLPLRNFIDGFESITPIYAQMSRKHSPPSYSGQLRAFNLHSAMLVLPPFDKWTIKILNSSPIEHLSAESVVGNFYTNWPAFLRNVHMPKLSSFHLNSPRTSLPELSRFMYRHRSITSCNLDITERSSSTSHPVFLKQSPPSTVFTSDAASISQALGVVSSKSFPPIRTLTLTANIYHDFLETLDISMLNTALASIARLTSPITLILVISGRCDSWLYVSPSVEAQKNRVEQSLKCVTNLELQIEGLPWAYVDVVSRWLAQFPALESVTLPNLHPGEEDELTGFIRAISKVNSRIKIIRIQGRLRTVEEWLATPGVE